MPLSRLPRPAALWYEPEPLPEGFDWRQLHSHRLIATLLYRNGIRDHATATAFLHAPDPTELDPTVLPNLAAGLARVRRAFDVGERIGIFGDYDCDGITSATVLTRAFRGVLPADQVVPFVPDRADGYGVSERGVRLLHDAGCTLLVAVDTGSNDHPVVKLAQDCGMDVVILDHHAIHSTGPDDAVLINPQLNDAGVGQELTGVGVAFLFVLALQQLGYPVARLEGGDLHRLLDLVALGTVADVGVVTGLNRSLVGAGMHCLRQTDRPGIIAMLRQGQLTQDAIDTGVIGFQLAPRLNATGRVATPTTGLQLMLAERLADAEPCAMQIEAWNTERKLRTNEILREVVSQITALPAWESLPLVALYGRSWDTGLVGPIASKVAEKLGVPAIIMQDQDGRLTGSGRSVPGVNLLRILDTAADQMIRYGGHSGAAGVTLSRDAYPAWLQQLQSAARDQGPLPHAPSITIHAWLPDAARRTDLVRALEVLEPFGRHNPQPVFGIQRARVLGVRAMGREDQHLKVTISAPEGAMDVLWFGGGSHLAELRLATTIDAAGTLAINNWQGQETLQLVAQEIRRSAAS